MFILNTHLDAGRSTSDRKVRAEQLNQILTKVKQVTAGEALIVAGDLNLRWNDPEDRALLENFMTDLSLKDSIGGTKSERGWAILDYILHRSGQTTLLEVIEVGEDLGFQYENGPLSDHPALFIRMLIN